MPHAKSLQLYLTLCNPMDWSLTDFSAHGILQTKILEWVPCPPPWDLPDPGIEPTPLRSPALAGGFFTTITTWEAQSSHKASQIFLLRGPAFTR